MIDKPEPGDLRIVTEFVNSVDLEGGTDELSSPAALAAWLAERSIPAADEALSRADLARALEVREAIRELLFANHEGIAPPPEALEALNRAARNADLVVSFGGDGSSRLAPAASGIEAAIGRLLGIVYTAMADGTWPRLKACRRESCKWAFYDHSRNQSRNWCSMKVCGNRTKAEQFRKRHEHA